MMSANSLKNNGFLPMFKNVFKRYAPVFIIVQILSVIYSVCLVLNEGLNYMHSEWLDLKIKTMLEAGTVSDITEAFSINACVYLMVVGVLVMFIIAISLFRDIYSKRASTFYFSMPVKRGAYFNANMLFGLCTIATSFLILVCVSLIGISTGVEVQEGVYVFGTAVFLRNLTLTCLCVAVLYAVFMLCAVLAGRAWHYLVLSFIAVISLNAGIIGLLTYLDNIWGFIMERSPAWIVSPIAAFGTVYYGENIGAKHFIALILQFALVYAAGYLVFKHRKAEVAEDSVSGKLVPAIMITIAMIAASFAGLAAGNLTFLGVTITSLSVLLKICVAVAAAVIVALLLTAVFYKKAFTKTTKKCLAVTVVITLIVVALVEIAPNGYKNYVPAANEVETVTIDENHDYFYYNDFTINLFSFFGMDDYLYYINYPIYSFSSDEAKAKVEELHKKMIDDTTIKNYGSDDFRYHGDYSVKLTYTLKNGKTVTRAYCVGTMDIFDEYIALMQTEEAIRQNPALSLSNEDILFAGVADNRDRLDEAEEDDYYYDDVPYYSEPAYYLINEYVTLDDYSTLINNIVKDKTAEPRDVFNNLLSYNMSSFYIYDYDNIRFSDENWDHYQNYDDITIMLYVFTNAATDDQKKLMATMTPAEMLEYDYTCETGENDQPDPITYEYISINAEADANTYAYLQSLGVIE